MTIQYWYGFVWVLVLNRQQAISWINDDPVHWSRGQYFSVSPGQMSQIEKKSLFNSLAPGRFESKFR